MAEQPEEHGAHAALRKALALARANVQAEARRIQAEEMLETDWPARVARIQLYEASARNLRAQGQARAWSVPAGAAASAAAAQQDAEVPEPAAARAQQMAAANQAADVFDPSEAHAAALAAPWPDWGQAFAARLEADRLEPSESGDERLKAARLEAERLEAERLEEEEEEAMEAERLEAERLEAKWLEEEEEEAMEAERLEAERLEAERLEAERVEAPAVVQTLYAGFTELNVEANEIGPGESPGESESEDGGEADDEDEEEEKEEEQQREQQHEEEEEEEEAQQQQQQRSSSGEADDEHEEEEQQREQQQQVPAGAAARLANICVGFSRIAAQLQPIQAATLAAEAEAAELLASPSQPAEAQASDSQGVAAQWLAQAPPYVHKRREVQAPPPPTDPDFAPPPPPTQPPLGPTALPPPQPPRQQKGQGVSPGRKTPHEVLHPQHGPQIWRLELDCEWCNACFTTPWAGGGTPTEKVKAEGWCKIGTSWHRHQCQQCKAQGLKQRVDGRDARLHRAERRELRAANRLKPAGTGSSSSTARAGTGASSSTAGVTELAFLVPPAPATEQVQQGTPKEANKQQPRV